MSDERIAGTGDGLRGRMRVFLGDWGEPLAYGLAALGLLWALERMHLLGGPVGWIALGLAALVLWRLGRAAYAASLLRRGAAEGPGLVEVDERRIAYLAAEGGRVVTLEGLTRVAILGTSAGPFADDLFWSLESEGADPLLIPSGAVGADKLLAVLQALPGFDNEAVIRAMGATDQRVTEVWRRS